MRSREIYYTTCATTTTTRVVAAAVASIRPQSVNVPAMHLTDLRPSTRHVHSLILYALRHSASSDKLSCAYWKWTQCFCTKSLARISGRHEYA